MESPLDAVSDVYGLIYENTSFIFGHLAIYGLSVERKTAGGKHARKHGLFFSFPHVRFSAACLVRVRPSRSHSLPVPTYY